MFFLFCIDNFCLIIQYIHCMSFNNKIKKSIYVCSVLFIGCVIGAIFYKYGYLENDKVLPVIQNDKNDIFYGETLYPEQIKAVIKDYNNKYNINISFAENTEEFLNILKDIDFSKTPIAIFQYNEGHKYGFIFVKYNGIDYCICVDTIPTLSNYTKKLITKDNDLFIELNGKKYKVMMFGENLQKAQKGCGSFTLAILKQLLKNDAEYLFEALDLYIKYGVEDKTKRDIEKKSCIRGVKFEYIKDAEFAPEIYKYSQNMSLQAEFDDRLVGNKQKQMKEYRMTFGKIKVDENGKAKLFSTKVFQITQKYKDASLSKPVNQRSYYEFVKN